jgi:hypothetical protein
MFPYLQKKKQNLSLSSDQKIYSAILASHLSSQKKISTRLSISEMFVSIDSLYDFEFVIFSSSTYALITFS